MNQQVFSVSTSGTLPWGLPAGKIAIAIGFEDRLEQQRNQRDPLQLGASGVFESGNFSQFLLLTQQPAFTAKAPITCRKASLKSTFRS